MLSFVPCRLRTEHFILQGSLLWFCYGFFDSAGSGLHMHG